LIHVATDPHWLAVIGLAGRRDRWWGDDALPADAEGAFSPTLFRRPRGRVFSLRRDIADSWQTGNAVECPFLDKSFVQRCQALWLTSVGCTAVDEKKCLTPWQRSSPEILPHPGASNSLSRMGHLTYNTARRKSLQRRSLLPVTIFHAA